MRKKGDSRQEDLWDVHNYHSEFLPNAHTHKFTKFFNKQKLQIATEVLTTVKQLAKSLHKTLSQTHSRNLNYN